MQWPSHASAWTYMASLSVQYDLALGAGKGVSTALVDRPGDTRYD